MDHFSKDFEVLEANSELLKALAHPVRLCIVKGLIENGPCNVSNMHNCLNLPQSTVSQHVSKLRSAGILKGFRNGTEIVYEICDKKVESIVKAMFEI